MRNPVEMFVFRLVCVVVFSFTVHHLDYNTPFSQNAVLFFHNSLYVSVLLSLNKSLIPKKKKFLVFSNSVLLSLTPPPAHSFLFISCPLLNSCSAFIMLFSLSPSVWPLTLILQLPFTCTIFPPEPLSFHSFDILPHIRLGLALFIYLFSSGYCLKKPLSTQILPKSASESNLKPIFFFWQPGSFTYPFGSCILFCDHSLVLIFSSKHGNTNSEQVV